MSLSNTSESTRIESIDFLKGLVMVIMALDHVRDYFHYATYLFNPSDPSVTTIPIYFTRYITNFCAPTFSFLAGLSAFMSGRRKTKKDLSIFLLTRGLWLIFLELTIVNFAWQFDPTFQIDSMAVIAVLGSSMVCLAGLIHLPHLAILIFSCALIFFHNLLDTTHFPGSFVWSYLHEANTFSILNGMKLYLEYPIIPWVGIMGLGYCFGPMYDPSCGTAKRRRLLRVIGFSSLGLFIALRWSNLYGDPVLWEILDTPARTMMSFLRISKYPPSLLYCLVTLGAAIIFLAFSENARGRISSFFSTFGRVPFFYYILHIFLIHILAIIFADASGFGWEKMILPDWIVNVPYMKGYGFSLWVVYGVWAAVVLMLYPLCKWFDRYKKHNKQKWWLSYL